MALLFREERAVAESTGGGQAERARRCMTLPPAAPWATPTRSRGWCCSSRRSAPSRGRGQAERWEEAKRSAPGGACCCHRLRPGRLQHAPEALRGQAVLARAWRALRAMVSGNCLLALLQRPPGHAIASLRPRASRSEAGEGLCRPSPLQERCAVPLLILPVIQAWAIDAAWWCLDLGVHRRPCCLRTYGSDVPVMGVRDGEYEMRARVLEARCEEAAAAVRAAQQDTSCLIDELAELRIIADEIITELNCEDLEEQNQRLRAELDAKTKEIEWKMEKIAKLQELKKNSPTHTQGALEINTSELGGGECKVADRALMVHENHKHEASPSLLFDPTSLTGTTNPSRSEAGPM